MILRPALFAKQEDQPEIEESISNNFFSETFLSYKQGYNFKEQDVRQLPKYIEEPKRNSFFIKLLTGKKSNEALVAQNNCRRDSLLVNESFKMR